MNKEYLNSLTKDQLENRIYDLNNELNQEWHLERIMKLKTAQRLQREVAFCEQLLKEKEKHFQEFGSCGHKVQVNGRVRLDVYQCKCNYYAYHWWHPIA